MKSIFEVKNGLPVYSVEYKNKSIIADSALGFDLQLAPDLIKNFKITDIKTDAVNEKWEQPWGEDRVITSKYNETLITLTQQDKLSRQLILCFRSFDDGIAFRYEFPTQENLKDFVIMDELTEFTLQENGQAWHLPAMSKDRYEYLYQKQSLKDLETAKNTSHTPFTIENQQSFISIHEANLTDFASMTLKNKGNNKLESELVPWADGTKVKVSETRVTPWRTIKIGDKAVDLINSHLELNLNEPCKLMDTDWLQPAKYVGIWWAMHLGKYSWGSGPKHGATNAITKEYIDFAAEHGFKGVLVEGWNYGWDDWPKNGHLFRFTESYPDFNVEELMAYGAKKGVKLIGHHETAGAIQNYEDQIEDAFAYYNKVGINTTKTGYVKWGQNLNRFENGKIVSQEWHHGQWMVNHYRKAVEVAAKNKVMLVVHEGIKDTGIRRTYPNMMTRECARGQEFNAWDAVGGNPPNHTAILPFTRSLSGPMDFTPGIFDIKFKKDRKPRKKGIVNRVNTTLAKQLALYVTVYSPQHMAADLPENYKDQPALKFITDVPVDWERSVALEGAIGQYIVQARKDRNSDDWYLGALTNEDAREITLKLDFLDANTSYRAEIYADADETNLESNPTAIAISSKQVKAGDQLKIKMTAGGGQAIRFISIK